MNNAARSARPHLLFLGQSLPYPIDSGAHIRTYHTMRLLASAFDVSAVLFHRRSARPTDVSSEGLAGIRNVPGVRHASVHPLPQESSRLRWVLDHLRSIAAGTVYTAFMYDSREVRDEITRIARERPIDVVHLDSLDLSAYVPPLLGRVPIACSHHNIESELLARRAALAANPFRRQYMRLQSRFGARGERALIPELDLNLVVSDLERREFERRVGDARYHVLPNCVDTARFAPRTVHDGRGILFLGGYAWEPNRDAMDYFCREILPAVRAEEPGYPVRWLAKADPRTCRLLSSEYEVEVVGYVHEIRPHIAGARCYVVPLRVGGGTRLKIIEAWSMGSAVVSTSIGAEGLAVRPGGNILIADDPRDFARRVLDVIRDGSLRERLGMEARQTAVTQYDWNAQRDALVAQYRALLNDPRAGPFGGEA